MTYSISKNTTSSLEDYLEAIIMLKEQHKKPTVTALSESINVKKPSVDWALKKLSDAGLVIHERYGDITLTPKGTQIANEVYRRHKALYSFLTDILKIDPEIAAEDACRMEHALSRESINRLEKFIDFVMVCHPGKEDWGNIFNRFIEQGIDDSEIQSRFAGHS
jgi:DtxR family transcriptional regulator, Mn-dependent transcriptional regulator